MRDRMVQAAIVNVIEPIFERDFAEHSYGFRPGRGCKDALRRVDRAAEGRLCPRGGRRPEGLLRHDPARPADGPPQEKIADGPVLSLIEAFLKADILDGLDAWTPETGAPQGAVLSPLLSNIYLDPLDHLMAQRASRWCATPTTS